MSEQQDLDDLVQRLRDTAASQATDPPPLGPPIGDWHRRLIRLRDEADRPYLSDSKRPTLGELAAVDYPVDGFLEVAYRYLLGRAPDAEGRTHYWEMARMQGRLVVLVELARAEEARRHIADHGLEPPASLDRLVAWRERLERLGPLRDRTLALWNRGLALAARRSASRWSQEAGLRRLMADMPVVAGALLELDQRQHHLASRSSKGGDAELPEGYGHFLARCDARPGPLEIDTARFREDCTRARMAGTWALDLGHAPPHWVADLARLGFDKVEGASEVGGKSGRHGESLADWLDASLSRLQASPEGRLALVSGFCLLGRVPLPRLYALVAAARRALAPGGMLLLEGFPEASDIVREELVATPEMLEKLLWHHGFTGLIWRESHPGPGGSKQRALVGFISREVA